MVFSQSEFKVHEASHKNKRTLLGKRKPEYPSQEHRPQDHPDFGVVLRSAQMKNEKRLNQKNA